MQAFKIYTDFITLGQFLKATAHIGSGGEAKLFLLNQSVLVNGERRIERGKKLFPLDKIIINKETYLIIYDQNSQY